MCNSESYPGIFIVNENIMIICSGKKKDFLGVTSNTCIHRKKTFNQMVCIKQ